MEEGESSTSGTRTGSIRVDKPHLIDQSYVDNVGPLPVHSQYFR